MYNSSSVYKRRSISAGVSRSLDVASIKNRIDNCKIINLFRNESLEAGYILNILYNLDKMTEMKMEDQQLNDETSLPSNIEQLFMNSFWEAINKFQIHKTSVEIDVQANTTTNESVAIKEDLDTEMDALLSMAFSQCTIHQETKLENSTTIDQQSTDGYKIYKHLNQITDFPMPLSIIIHDRLRDILRSRISAANKYVLQIFLDEYKVLDHLVNLQKVFFFGAGDLMLTFYSKLFMSVSISSLNSCHVMLFNWYYSQNAKRKLCFASFLNR